MTVNTDAINKTIEFMETCSDIQFDMGVYVKAPEAVNVDNSFDPYYESGNHEPVCGTVCCLAGYTVAANNDGLLKSYGADYFTLARTILGLNKSEARELFLPSVETGAYEATLEDGIKMLKKVRDERVTDWKSMELPFDND